MLPTHPLSSGHQTVRGQKSGMFLLFFFLYPPYHSSFRLCVLKGGEIKGPDTMLSLLLPVKFDTQHYLSEDKAKEFFLFVYVTINTSLLFH